MREEPDPAPIRTLRELVDAVQDLVDATGKHVNADALQAVLDRVEDDDDDEGSFEEM